MMIEVVTDREIKAICKIYDYLVEDEKKHWEESNRPKEHIYLYIRDLKSLVVDSKKVMK